MTKAWAEVWSFREEIYSFFANQLLKPVQEENKKLVTEEFWRNFPLEVANEQIKSGLEQLIKCTSNLDEQNLLKAVEEVNVEYTELFIGPGAPKAPPWESFYNTRKKLFFGTTAFVMKDLLNKQGLESKNSGRQPEDHLGLELLYLAVLTEKLHDQDIESQVNNIKDQLSFMDEHLLSWIPNLYDDAKESASVGFYSGLLQLIWGTLLWDKELLAEFLAEFEVKGEVPLT
ncbi:molecular chaperone TorD family protein [Bacillus sp. B15-48]|uniref:TorD/DmsD family molecular chaperone n=1 Tax=Bacillus sp. B15-48 TaxID=1548601 RepID=UPI00193F8FC8|nr:molecular chaperone TorD family protein [Bacillus sp. B15-48]MBM4765342.1 dehydrogenase [Bacillus sp. B15-48]